VVGGYGSHRWLDRLNLRGIDLFWPSPIRRVTPGNRHGRFPVGGRGERILLAVLIGLTVALYPLRHLGFRDGLQALLRNFDIAREQYQRVAGTHGYDLELTATDPLTLQPVRGKFPVVGVWQNGLIVEQDGTLRAVGPSPNHHNLYLLQARLIAGEPLQIEIQAPLCLIETRQAI
jgi:inner membrane protein